MPTNGDKMKFQKFRKKPIVIEAFQLTTKILLELLTIQDSENEEVEIKGVGCHVNRFINGKVKSLSICTLEGWMEANIGDWIIKGINGEIYPCKPDIFAKTYEMVEI